MSEEEAAELIDVIKSVSPFADILKNYISDKGISQFLLASKINATPATVNLWIKSSRFPKSDMIYHIANGLELTEQETDILQKSWQTTNTLRSSLAYLEEAFQNKDYSAIHHVGQGLKKLLSDKKQDKKQTASG